MARRDVTTPSWFYDIRVGMTWPSSFEALAYRRNYRGVGATKIPVSPPASASWHRDSVGTGLVSCPEFYEALGSPFSSVIRLRYDGGLEASPPSFMSRASVVLYHYRSIPAFSFFSRASVVLYPLTEGRHKLSYG
jgi:hypothetical protein